MALQYLIQMYESSFLTVARQYFRDEVTDLSPQSLASSTDSIISPNTISRVFSSRHNSRQILSPGHVSSIQCQVYKCCLDFVKEYDMQREVQYYNFGRPTNTSITLSYAV